jgi:hypothetical protein
VILAKAKLFFENFRHIKILQNDIRKTAFGTLAAKATCSSSFLDLKYQSYLITITPGAWRE